MDTSSLFPQPLTEVVRGSEAPHLHVLFVVGPALQNRGDSLQTEETRREVEAERERERGKKDRKKKKRSR